MCPLVRGTGKGSSIALRRTALHRRVPSISCRATGRCLDKSRSPSLNLIRLGECLIFDELGPPETAPFCLRGEGRQRSGRGVLLLVPFQPPLQAQRHFSRSVPMREPEESPFIYAVGFPPPVASSSSRSHNYIINLPRSIPIKFYFHSFIFHLFRDQTSPSQYACPRSQPAPGPADGHPTGRCYPATRMFIPPSPWPHPDGRTHEAYYR